MFKFMPRPRVTWPVTVHLPKDGGVTEAQPPFDVTFELMPDGEVEESYKADPLGKELLRKAIKGWDETKIGDADGNPLKFSAESLNTLLDIGYVRLALATTFNRLSIGAREKN